MANAVRKMCARIGHGHQYLMGAPKTSSRGGHPVPDAVHGHAVERLQNEKLRKLRLINGVSGKLQSPYAVDQLVVKNQAPVSVAVSWFNGVSSPIRLSSTATKRDGSLESTSCDEDSNTDGRPSAEQLELVFNKLEECLPALFKQNLDFRMFHPKLVFENNIRGTKTVGLEYFVSTVSILRLIGHLKYAYVKFDVLKMTKHPEDGTIKVRWRIKGISGMKVFMKFWKFRLWNLEQVIKENVEFWHDGFSIFYLGSDGLVHKLTADKMQPDNDPVLEDKSSLATKLALFLGLSPQLNSLDCLMSNEAEQANELFKMVIMSLEEVV